MGRASPTKKTRMPRGTGNWPIVFLVDCSPVGNPSVASPGDFSRHVTQHGIELATCQDMQRASRTDRRYQAPSYRLFYANAPHMHNVAARVLSSPDLQAHRALRCRRARDACWAVYLYSPCKRVSVNAIPTWFAVLKGGRTCWCG